ncbi:MAG TPA: phosphatase PAP2 family protein, partial [Streptomyces sp.]
SRGRGTLLLGAAFAAATAAIGLAVAADAAHPGFQSLDDRWLTWMGGPHRGVLEAVASVLNWFGGPLGVVVPLALLAVLMLRRRWWSALFFSTAYLGGSFGVVQVLKSAVDRPRPLHPLVRVDHGSFPSGHSFGAALLVVLVGALFVAPARRRWWWPAGAVFVAVMMWSRTWLHAHWLSDTVAGALAGAATALLAWWAFAPLLAREADLRQVSRPAAACAVPGR